MAATNKSKTARSSRSRSTKKPLSTSQQAAAAPQTGAGSQRTVVTARTPAEQLKIICAQNANRTRGEVQEEWFALGTYIGLYGRTQQQQQHMTNAVSEPPIGTPLGTMSRAMAAGAGSGD